MNPLPETNPDPNIKENVFSFNRRLTLSRNKRRHSTTRTQDQPKLLDAIPENLRHKISRELLSRLDPPDVKDASKLRVKDFEQVFGESFASVSRMLQKCSYDLKRVVCDGTSTQTQIVERLRESIGLGALAGRVANPRRTTREHLLGQRARAAGLVLQEAQPAEPPGLLLLSGPGQPQDRPAKTPSSRRGRCPGPREGAPANPGG